MEVKWLEDFIALAHNKSFSRAAQVRSITQSGFSRRIRGLEEWVGAELVDRSSFPPTLTAAGRQFLEVAEDVTQKLLDARTAIRTEQGMRGSGLKIAAGHTIALSFVPSWLNTLSDSIRGSARARDADERARLRADAGERQLRADVRVSASRSADESRSVALRAASRWAAMC